MNPRKIIYVTTDLLTGGAEGTLARMVVGNPRLADEIIVVSLLPGNSHAAQLQAAGVTVVELDFGRPAGIASGLYRLAKLIAANRPDIVQGWMYHGDIAALIALGLSGRRRQTHLVWSIRCSNLDLRFYRPGLRLVVRACAAFSSLPDAITANSVAGAKSHLALGYRPRRMEILANGIDVDHVKPDPNARTVLRNQLGLSEDAFIISHVARVDPMKDHATLLAGLAELPNMYAFLIGAGTEHLTNKPNVFCLGRREDVPQLLAAADIVVSSSAFGEGFSNVLGEGMACGLPAVATDVGDARMIVGDTGFIVPPRDPRALAAAIRLLADEPQAARADRGAKARRHIVENFSMAKAMQRWVGLYASLDYSRS